jgi:hypothetical protein
LPITPHPHFIIVMHHHHIFAHQLHFTLYISHPNKPLLLLPPPGIIQSTFIQALACDIHIPHHIPHAVSPPLLQ